MGKKKLSLKPANRGFTTTSIASKKPPAQLDKQPELVQADSAASTSRDDLVEIKADSGGTKDGQTETKEDWDDPELSDKIQLQEIDDRLHDKAEKEVVRILKAIDLDKRLAKAFPVLDLQPELRDRILQLALDESSSDHSNKSFSSSSSPELDKVYIKLYVIQQVLARLGFTSDRISQYLEGVGEEDDWQSALEWMWLRLSEDECLSRGNFAPASEPHPSQVDSLPLESSNDGPTAPIQAPPRALAPEKEEVEAPATSSASLFRSLESSSSSDTSDSDLELDPKRYNSSWVKLMLKLEELRINTPGPRGGKGRTGSFASWDPVVKEIERKLGMIENEYLFDRKEAELALKSLKSQRKANAIKRKFDIAKRRSAEEASEPTDMGAHDESDDEGDGFFGVLLDDVGTTALPHGSEGNTLTRIRSMPIPKSYTVSGGLPTSVLRSALSKASKSAVLTYARLSGESRAIRMGLEIRWSMARNRVWRMDDIACNDKLEAENYIATLALSDLESELGVVNWRSLPPAFRELWDELREEKQSAEKEKRLELWTMVRRLVGDKFKDPTGPRAAPDSRPKSEGATSKEIHDEDVVFDPTLQSLFQRRLLSAPYRNMRVHRDTLPIAAFRDQILSILASSQVMVLSGETGCGKSTQLPAFILEDQLSQGLPCKIFVTEPRRISAISLADRVAKELGEVHGPGSLVGYSVRLDAKISSVTRLAFVTNGIALRMLEEHSSGKSAFDEVTHIIVDEVHERSIESDFLLIVLKSLMENRKNLKVILMSATLDAEKVSAYFGNCPFLAIPGRTYPVQVNYLEDAVQLADWHVEDSRTTALHKKQFAGAQMLEWAEDTAKPDDSDSQDEEDADPSKLTSAKYSANTVSTVNLMDPRQIPYDLIVRLLEKLCFENDQLRPYSKATLIFMPGLAEIRRLNDTLLGHPAFGSSEFVIYPLHSSVSSEGQSAVFNVPSQGIRKIVISTNIAETGVTIPDITCVIDSGKHREMRYDEKRQISRLVEAYIARSNAKQRRGRAGRVQEGIAFHLFTKARHDTKLAEHSIPEMLRLSLQDLALRIKILKVKLGTTIEDVLSRALDPPSSINIQRAIAALVEVKALSTAEDITPVGRLLSKLPMDVHLGKFLLTATLFKCLDPALTIAATLNSKSPFVKPFGLETAADAAKRSFAIGDSDFLTIVNAFNSWRRASDDTQFVRKFCQRNFLSQQNLQQIEELRQQFLAFLKDSSIIDKSTISEPDRAQARSNYRGRTRFVPVPEELNSNAEDLNILNGALVAGLYPKILCLEKNGALRTIGNQQTVAIHPSSVNFKANKAAFGTQYLMYFSIVQSKRLYAWETSPVDDRALLLLCGEQADCKLLASSIQIDRKLQYQIPTKSVLAIKILRERWLNLISSRLRGRTLSERDNEWFEVGLQCLRQKAWDDQGPSIGVT